MVARTDIQYSVRNEDAAIFFDGAQIIDFMIAQAEFAVNEYNSFLFRYSTVF